MALNDRRMAFGLAAVLLVIVVVEAFVWLPSYRASSDPSAQPRAATAPTASNPLASAAPAQSAGLGDYDRDTPPGPAGRDPFTPPSEVRHAARASATVVAARRPTDSGARRPVLLPALPAGDLLLRPAGVPSPAAPVVELKGVIPGDPAIAVVNVGGDVHYKEEGDSLGGGLRLLRITEAGVVIQRAGRNVVLDVGHTLPAEPDRGVASPVLAPRLLPPPVQSQSPLRATAPAIQPITEPRTAPKPAAAVAKPPSTSQPDVTVTAQPAPAARAHRRAPHRRVRARTSDGGPLAGHFVGRRL